MEKLAKFGKTIRSNWKKSLLGVVALYYGASTAKERYEINVLMQAACKEAAQYGESTIPMDRQPTVVTVILNPVANKRKSKKDFEKYCEPLLHLAGLQVEVVQTTSEGNAKEIAERLHGTEAIIVAGGDGTLSETVTGLLRRNDEANRFPLGILPLGRTNLLGNTMFPGGNGIDKVKQLINASMAIIKGDTVLKDAMKIEQIAHTEEAAGRPIYAMSSIEWGAFRDTMARRDKYWWLGSLRDYATFFFNGYKTSLTWNCTGTVKYTPPCAGCSNCVTKKPEFKRKWLFFTTPMQAADTDYSKNINPECSVSKELCFKTTEVRIKTPNIDKNVTEIPGLRLLLGKNKFSYPEFVFEGWSRLKGEKIDPEGIVARTIEFLPKEPPSEKEVIEIDKEEYDVKPIKITLVPRVVKIFCSPQSK